MSLIKAISLFLLSCVAALMPHDAHAQGRVKKLVFQDCKEARLEMAKLQAAEKTEFISYLGRVLRMKAGVAAETMPDSAIPNFNLGQPSPVNDVLRGSNMLQILDPARESEAKQCSLELLLELAPESFVTVPDMVEVSQDLSLSGELRNALETAIWALLTRVKSEPAYSIDEKFFSRMIAQLTSEAYGYFAANVLIELHQRSIPSLLNALSSPDRKSRDRVNDVLLRIDSSGDTIGPEILPLMSSGDDDLRVRAAALLAKLDGFYPKSLPAVIAQLDDPSPEVQRAAYHALGTAFSNTEIRGTLALPQESLATLVEEFKKPSPEHRLLLENALSVELLRVPASRAAVLELARDPDPDLRAHAFHLLGTVSEANEEIADALIDGAFDKSAVAKIAALEALGAIDFHSDEKAGALLKVLKTNASEKDVNLKQSVILYAAASVEKLTVTPSMARLSPYFIEALSFRDSGGLTMIGAKPVSAKNAIQALVHIGGDVVSPLVKALKDDDSLVRGRAVEVLAQIGNLERGNVKLLVHMLNDPDEHVRSVAVDVLPRFGAPIESEVRKGLSWKDPGSQLAAARVLLALNQRDPALTTIFRDNFAKAGCAQKLQLLDDLLKSDEQFRQKSQSSLLECMGSQGTDLNFVLDALRKTAPLDEVSSNRLLELIQDKKFARTLQLQFIERARELGVPAASLVEALKNLLKVSDNSQKNRIVPMLGSFGPAAAAAVEQLKDIASDKSQEQILRSRAEIALQQIDPKSDDPEKFFAAQIRGDSAQQALMVLSESKAEIAVPILAAILRDSPAELKAQVISLIGRFDIPNPGLVDQLAKFLDDSDPRVRFQATVAVLKLNPDPKLAEAPLRRELVGKFSRELLEEKFPEAVRSILVQVSSQPKSFVEGRAADELLRRLEKNR